MNARISTRRNPVNADESGAAPQRPGRLKATPEGSTPAGEERLLRLQPGRQLGTVIGRPLAVPPT
jgi:hypothetical protein